MARIDSLSILLSPTGKDKLAEKYGAVIDNIQTNTLFSMLKNNDLSGNPDVGSLEAKRFVNTESAPYRTARDAGKGSYITAKPVTVPVDIDRELIKEIESKDVSLYGVDNIINTMINNQRLSLIRELERAFFAEASAKGTLMTPIGSNPLDILSEVIVNIETTKNDFVDGVPRDIISVIMSPASYSQVRLYLDVAANNANVTTAAEFFTYFHGVRVFSSNYLPDDVSMIAMVDGSIALPLRTTQATPERVQFSNAISFGIFFSYGVTAVMPDLITKVAKSSPPASAPEE
jgi:hypothetical protein